MGHLKDDSSDMNKFKFLVRDEELWNDNSKKIIEGESDKSKLYFYEKNLTKCFLDFSFMENINLRNTLLLYDQVFIGCPSEAVFDDFLKKQNVTKDNLIELSAKGRIKFLACGSDKMYNKDFLNEVFIHNEDSIITSKAMCCLLACDIVEMARPLDNLNSDELSIIKEIFNSIGPKGNDFFNAVTWPLNAKNLCLELLNKEGVAGVNQLGITKQLYSELDKLDSGRAADIDLTLIINSHNIFMASALNATYFPYFTGCGDDFANNVLGTLLNQYKISASRLDDDHRDLQDEAIMQNKVDEIGAMHLLDAKVDFDILRVEEFTDENKTTQYLKDILIGIKKIKDKDLIREKIQEYNNIIYDIQNVSKIKKIDKLSYVLEVGGCIPVYGTPFSIISFARSLFNDVTDSDKKKVMKIIGKVSERIIDKREKESIYLLNKLNTVARLKSD